MTTSSTPRWLPTYESAGVLAVWPLFLLIDSGSLANLYLGLALVCIGTGLTYGPQSALYSEPSAYAASSQAG
ncbi:hypothetical protein AB0K08_01225 [Citricoccus sp. NPDC055426]|uniref:hypothetical protein n=1 Tax=Citricoccus sp. NPDC055426 TaxID=3155536 RepID=UPI00342ADEB4